MSTKAPKQTISSQATQQALETLRSRLVELEAIAHAAEQALQDLPFMPLPPADEDAPPYTDKDLGVRRLHALVVATASAARMLLQDADHAVQSPGDTRLLPARTGTGSSRASESWEPYGGRAPKTLTFAELQALALGKF
jgi:hypothetical protein